MKGSHVTFVLAAALVAACAAPQATTMSAAGSRPSAYYCAKERLIQSGDRLDCNWQPTIDDACRYSNSSVLQQGALASQPQPAGRCNTGEWLVKVSPR